MNVDANCLVEALKTLKMKERRRKLQKGQTMLMKLTVGNFGNKRAVSTVLENQEFENIFCFSNGIFEFDIAVYVISPPGMLVPCVPAGEEVGLGLVGLFG
jgi:hypothetical protein